MLSVPIEPETWHPLKGKSTIIMSIIKSFFIIRAPFVCTYIISIFFSKIIIAVNQALN